MLRLNKCLLTIPLLTAACDLSLGKKDEGSAGEVTIRFDARVGDQTVECGQFYNVGSTGEEVQFQDMRLYVSNVRLINEDGEEVPVELDQDSAWQHENAVMLDFEDATSHCLTQTTAETNHVVKGRVPNGNYKGLVFDVGLPFELNHGDAATAEPPLDSAGMFWTWASGYKYIKVDLERPDGSMWYFHLGSRDCHGSMGADDPPERCVRPMLASIRLNDFDPDENVAVLDIAQLLIDTDITAEFEGSQPGCMTLGPVDDECRPIVNKLGLEWETGLCFARCQNQTAFRVE